MIEQFSKEVEEGLSKEEKTLPSKYFYNQRGDELFVQIMQMPEYYLTRSELEIFQKQKLDIITSFGFDNETYFEVVELGAGDGTKTIELLRELVLQEYSFDYLPVDISQNALDGLEEMLNNEIPSLKIRKQQGEYFEVLKSLKSSQHPKVVLFLGSNIGNLTDVKAQEFIYRLGSKLRANDALLLGVDAVKAKEIVLPAYNDAQGITAAFNMNLLQRINDELQADFNLLQFEHAPHYDENEGIAKSYLRSKAEQKVKINSLNKVFHFEEGELIHTEISRKYNDEVLNKILEGSDFKIEHKFSDAKNYFFDYLLKRY